MAQGARRAHVPRPGLLREARPHPDDPLGPRPGRGVLLDRRVRPLRREDDAGPDVHRSGRAAGRAAVAEVARQPDPDRGPRAVRQPSDPLLQHEEEHGRDDPHDGAAGRALRGPAEALPDPGHRLVAYLQAAVRAHRGAQRRPRPPRPGLFGSGAEAFVRAGFGVRGSRQRVRRWRGHPPRAGAAMVAFAGLPAALDRIPDPRRRQGRRYGLARLLLFSVLAVSAGATSCRRIRLFVGAHRERLDAAFGARFRRAPAVDTLRALLHALDPAEPEAAFRRAERLDDVPAPPGRRVVAPDGETPRGSFDHLDDRAPAQVLSAFAGEAALTLAHREIAEGDEVAAVQALIARPGLSGVLLTADAL